MRVRRGGAKTVLQDTVWLSRIVSLAWAAGMLSAPWLPFMPPPLNGTLGLVLFWPGGLIMGGIFLTSGRTVITVDSANRTVEISRRGWPRRLVQLNFAEVRGVEVVLIDDPDGRSWDVRFAVRDGRTEKLGNFLAEKEARKIADLVGDLL
ncbi:MAG: hypothetical protein K0R83_800 [Caulobacter sp.]|jgi:hypothetical protein|nr:hypothetical protein [Caulobacter sp.]